jgi:hypothetical protein
MEYDLFGHSKNSYQIGIYRFGGLKWEEVGERGVGIGRLRSEVKAGMTWCATRGSRRVRAADCVRWITTPRLCVAWRCCIMVAGSASGVGQ